MIKKGLISFLTINIIAFFLFFLFHESKAKYVTKVYNFENISLRLLGSKPTHPQKMARLKIAYTKWRIDEIAEWFNAKPKEISNPIRDEHTYIMEGGDGGTVTVTNPKGKQFISYINNISKNKLKPINTLTVNKLAAHNKVVDWLKFRGNLPWDASLSKFKPILRFSGDKVETIGYELKYTHKFENYLISDDLIKVEISKDDVLSYYRQWTKLISLLPKPKKIIDIDQALKRLAYDIKDSDQKTVNIKQAQLVYYNPSRYFGSVTKTDDILYPAWQIEIENGGIVLVDAYTGDVKKKY